MGYSRYVGRVGALAVALGIGAAAATTPAIAWAGPDSDSTTSTDAGTSSVSESDTTDTAVAGQSATQADSGSQSSGPAAGDIASHSEAEASPSADTTEVAPGVTVSSSGGAHTSTAATESAKASPKVVAKPRKPQSHSAAEESSQLTAKPNATVSAQTATGGTFAQSATTEADSADTTPATTSPPASLFAVPAAAAQAVQVAAATSVSAATRVFAAVTAAILGNGSGGVDSPLAWVFAAAARRQFDPSTARVATAAPAAQALTSQSLTATATANLPPTIGALTLGTADPTTGAVAGKVNATDPENKTLSYALTTGPDRGSVIFDKRTGKFTYTPTAAQRVLAGLTSVPDATITVTVSDGTNKVPTVVSVPIAPTPVQNLSPVTTPGQPSAVAATDRRAYVANSNGTLTVVDTVQGTVLNTLAVGSNPTAVVVKPDGSKVYVTNAGSNSVSVIDGSTNTAKAPISLGFTPSSLAIAPNGKTIYVGDAAGDLVKISTSTDKVTGTVAGTGGTTSIVVSPDGKKIYATTASGIAVFSSYSSTAKPIAVAGVSPRILAVSRDNTKLYALTGTNTVTVVETSKYTVVGGFTVSPSTFTAVNPMRAAAVNKDGSLLFAMAQDGTLSVLDTASQTELTALDTGTSAAGLAASPDGMQLYVADGAGSALRVVSVVPTNTRPTVGAPTTNANQTTGVIDGATGVTDGDADPLKITLTSAPARGKVTFNPTGGYTYTPTTTARRAAALDTSPFSALTDTFTFTVDDGRRGIVTQTITLPVVPKNGAPTTKTTVGTPNSTTGVVTGSVTATDPDGDKRVFDGTTVTAKGSVVVTSAGKFTYIPTVSARHAAATSDPSAKTDTFTVTVDDGHGGVVGVPVTVTILPRNSALTGVAATNVVTNTTTGRATGRVIAVDADKDAVSFVAPGSTAKGSIVVNADGTFTYTPTAAARSAAGAVGASPDALSDSFTVTVNDGHGSVQAVTVNVAVDGSAPGNSIPVAAVNPYETSVDSSTGVVTGHVNVTDASTLTYSLTSAVDANVGTVALNGTTGAFTFTPTTRARYHAWFTPGPDAVVFTVAAFDGQDGTPVDVTATISARHPDEDGSLSLAELKDLVANGDVDVSANSNGSTVRAIDGTFTSTTVSDTAAAAQVLNNAATLLGAPAGFANAQNITVQTLDGPGTETFYRLSQKVNGVTVLGSEVVLATDADGRVTGVFSNYHSAITTVNTTPASTINTEAEAVAFAEDEVLDDYVSAASQATKDAFLASLTFDTDLVVYDLDANNAPTLAWRVKVLTTPGTGPVPGDQVGSGYPSVGATYYLYANGTKAGDVVVQFASAQQAVATPLRSSGSDLLGTKRTVSAANTGTTVVLSDLTRNITTYVTDYDDVHFNGEPIIPGRIETYSSKWASTAVSAQANMTRVYDYYSVVLGRDSYDDQHGDIILSIDYNPSGESATGWKNAAWDGTQLVFGDTGNTQAALDVVGHEYTHGVIQYINEMAYLGESGALNEAYADIMGALIEDKTGDGRWLFAEDASGNPYRDMSDPSAYSQPETYANRYVDSCGCTENDDYDGVHRNSSIMSFAAYKMMDATKDQISGEQWAKVFYDSLYRMPSTARFVDARSAVISSARANGFTDEQIQAIKTAFNAVGVGAQNLAV